MCGLNTSRSRWIFESNVNGRRILDAAKPELETGRKKFPTVVLPFSHRFMQTETIRH